MPTDKSAAPTNTRKTPKDIVSFLYDNVIGPCDAKETLDIAAYNHYKRLDQKIRGGDLHEQYLASWPDRHGPNSFGPKHRPHAGCSMRHCGRHQHDRRRLYRLTPPTRLSRSYFEYGQGDFGHGVVKRCFEKSQVFVLKLEHRVILVRLRLGHVLHGGRFLRGDRVVVFNGYALFLQVWAPWPSQTLMAGRDNPRGASVAELI